MFASKISTLQNIKDNLSSLEIFREMNYFAARICCNSKTERYKRILEKADSQLTKELDLRKFIMRQRVFLHSIQGLLTGRQQKFVSQMSQLIVHESSANQTSSDNEHRHARQVILNQSLDHVWKMLNSDNLVD